MGLLFLQVASSMSDEGRPVLFHGPPDPRRNARPSKSLRLGGSGIHAPAMDAAGLLPAASVVRVRGNARDRLGRRLSGNRAVMEHSSRRAVHPAGIVVFHPHPPPCGAHRATRTLQRGKRKLNRPQGKPERLAMTSADVGVTCLHYRIRRMSAVSIVAATIRRGNTTAKYRRKACSMWDRRRVLPFPRPRRATITPSHRP